MTSSRVPEPADPMEEEGLPSMQDGLPQKEITGDRQDGIVVPEDHSLVVEDFGTTALEQNEGEPLDLKLSREMPDVGTASDERPDDGPHVSEPYPEDRDERVGRIVEPDEGARTDREADVVASDVGTDTGGFSAEERAMRIEPEA
jgi:hypothetical protein